MNDVVSWMIWTNSPWQSGKLLIYIVVDILMLNHSFSALICLLVIKFIYHNVGKWWVAEHPPIYHKSSNYINILVVYCYYCFLNIHFTTMMQKGFKLLLFLFFLALCLFYFFLFRGSGGSGDLTIIQWTVYLVRWCVGTQRGVSHEKCIYYYIIHYLLLHANQKKEILWRIG